MAGEIVVDACVATKWYVEEDFSDNAATLLLRRYSMHAPAFFGHEVAGSLLKYVRRGLLARVDVHERLRSLFTAPITLHAASYAVVADAFELATAAGLSIYDASYLAIARARSCRVVTADRQFYDRASIHWPHLMLWIEDLV